jgi:HTH-type transcriptional regulator/antitoxin HigA
MSKDSRLIDIYRLLEQPNDKRLIDLINEKKEEFSLSNLQLSKILSIDKTTFDRLIKKIEEGIVDSIEFYQILKICQFFQISVDDVSQLYVASLQPSSIAELELARKANFIVRTFDLKALKDQGFIDSLTDIKTIEGRIKTFFGLETVYEYDEEIGSVLFSRTKKRSQDKMREFWVRSAYYQFENINNSNDYDKEKLLALIPKIRAYTRYEEKGLLTVTKALYNIGVTVIVQSYLTKTQVRGATFVVHDKPCIVITDYNKSYATIWLALMHELYHVIYDFDELKAWKYHLTGEVDLNLFKEEYADFFACEILFPKEKLNFIRHQISSNALVSAYAEENKVHPSIIYSFYCFDEKLKGNDTYPFYSKYFGKPEKAIQMLKISPWEKDTIYDEVERIKQILELKEY